MKRNVENRVARKIETENERRKERKKEKRRKEDRERKRKKRRARRRKEESVLAAVGAITADIITHNQLPFYINICQMPC